MIGDKEIAKKWEQITGKEIPVQKLKRLRKICESMKCDQSDPFFTAVVISETQGDLAASEIREAYASGKKGLERDVQELRLEVLTAIARNASATIEDSITRETKAKLLQWTLAGVIVVAALFTSVGYFVYKQGFENGYIIATGELRDANAWATLPEGRRAYRNRALVESLLSCDFDRENWKTVNGLCYPFPNLSNGIKEAKVTGWKVNE